MVTSINGCCGTPKHMLDPLNFGASGVSAGSIFYFSRYSYKDIKDFLLKNKIKIRTSQKKHYFLIFK